MEEIYVERLHLLERTDIDAAIALAKSQKVRIAKRPSHSLAQT
ncbi:hypothetical protein OGZ01_31720 (plasmid) [Vibrio harveyi]|nr:hypothetical protein [Vibrio harveyi]